MKTHFDLLAPVYDRLIPSPTLSKLRRVLRLPTRGSLLEAGGGTGRISTGLKPLVGRLILYDPSQPMLRRAIAKGGIIPVRGLAEQLPFADSVFSRVLVVDALHHFDHQALAIGELIRVLKPGGRLVVEEPDINRWGVKLVALAERMALMGSHFHSPAEIAAMMSAFDVSTRVESDGGFAAWIIGEKCGSLQQAAGYSGEGE